MLSLDGFRRDSRFWLDHGESIELLDPTPENIERCLNQPKIDAERKTKAKRNMRVNWNGHVGRLYDLIEEAMAVADLAVDCDDKHHRQAQAMLDAAAMEFAKWARAQPPEFDEFLGKMDVQP